MARRSPKFEPKPERKAPALTPRQARFVSEYLVDLNATQAAIRAGYSDRTARSTGAEVLARPAVAHAIAEGRKGLEQATGITQERVLKEFGRLAFFDPRKLFHADTERLKKIGELDDDSASAIAGLEVESLYEGTGRDRYEAGVTHKIKLADRLGALNSIARHLGMFVDRKEISGPDGGPISLAFEDAIARVYGTDPDPDPDPEDAPCEP